MATYKVKIQMKKEACMVSRQSAARYARLRGSRQISVCAFSNKRYVCGVCVCVCVCVCATMVLATIVHGAVYQVGTLDVYH